MLNKILDEFLTGWVWVLIPTIPIIVIAIRKFYQQTFKKKYAKIIVYKIIHLRLKSLEHKPYYFRKHHSIDDIPDEPVYDEASVAIMTIATPSDKLHSEVTSSGFVDVYQIIPSFTKSKDQHPVISQSPKLTRFSQDSSISNMAVLGVLINGLQTEKDWWYGAIADHDEQDVTLVVDFSSLPNASAIITQEIATWKHNTNDIDEITIKRIGKDIFSVSQKCHIKDVLSIKFNINKEKLSAGIDS